MRRRHIMAAALGVAASPSAGIAQGEAWPTAPVRLVVPFPPGGPTDVFARRFAARASPLLGQPLVIDNRPGAGGTTGTAAVAKARRDGYTMVFGSSSTHVTGPYLISPAPYDPVEDFTLLMVGAVPMMLAVHPSVPARTLPELVSLVRGSPGRWSYASSGIGSINHLGGELFKALAGGLRAEHIPYRGNAPALQAGLSGEVQFLLDTFGTGLPYHRDGQLRVLAVCAELGVTTARVPGRSGVWVAADEQPGGRPERKVAAIGVRVSRGVTMHGFAINCDVDLAWYDRFVPCGISDAGVTSLSAELGRDVTVPEVAPIVERQLRQLLAWAPYERTPDYPAKPEPGRRVPLVGLASR